MQHLQRPLAGIDSSAVARQRHPLGVEVKRSKQEVWPGHTALYRFAPFRKNSAPLHDLLPQPAQSGHARPYTSEEHPLSIHIGGPR